VLEAEAMAGRVVKKFYDETKSDVYEMLLAAAIGKELERGDDGAYDPTARAYAQAGELVGEVNGIEYDVFRDLVMKAREKLEYERLTAEEEAAKKAVGKFGEQKGKGGRCPKKGRKPNKGGKNGK
jgi:hypothetical protein